MSSKLLLENNLTFYFDGHVGITDPTPGGWTNITNAVDGNTDDFAAAPGSATTTTSGYLYAQGTNAPISGGVISSVQVRLYGTSGTLGQRTSATIYTASLAEQLTA